MGNIPCFLRKDPLPVPYCIPKFLPVSCENISPTKIDQNVIGIIKRKYRQRKPHRILHCNICGDIAGSHSHYGGQACSSCRSFFRRAVQSEYNLAYFCMKDRNCEITKKSRKKCQYCRYQACLKAGMRPAWVSNEEEAMRLLKTKNKKKKLAKLKLDANKSPDIRSQVKPRVLCSKEEILEINDYVRTSEFFVVSKVKDMSHSLLRELIRLIAFHETLSSSGMREIKNVIERRSVMFASKLNDFNVLNCQDQENLLKRNIPLLLEMQISTFFQPDLVWRKQLLPLIGPVEVDKMDSKLKEMNMSCFPSSCSSVLTCWTWSTGGRWRTHSSSIWFSCKNILTEGTRLTLPLLLAGWVLQWTACSGVNSCIGYFHISKQINYVTFNCKIKTFALIEMI